MSEVYNKQIIPLEKASNVRDLGGYLTIDGNITSDVFLRGDSADIFSERDKDTLLNMGVRTVIDLRSNVEIEKTPSVFADGRQAEYYQISLLPEVDQNDVIRQSGFTFLIGDIYIAILERRQDELRQLFRIMTEAEEKVFFHCSAGKDRTGVVAAILLKLANVDDQTVIADYCLTEDFLGEKIAQMKAAIRQEENIPEAILDELMGAKPSNMEKLLAYVQHTWQSAEAYLSAIGLSDAEIATLKEKMIQTSVA